MATKLLQNHEIAYWSPLISMLFDSRLFCESEEDIWRVDSAYFHNSSGLFFFYFVSLSYNRKTYIIPFFILGYFVKARKTTLWCLTSWFGPLSLCSTVVRVLLSRSTGNLNSILRREAQTTIQALLVLTYHRLPQTDKCRHQHPKTRLLFFFLLPCPAWSFVCFAIRYTVLQMYRQFGLFIQ